MHFKILKVNFLLIALVSWFGAIAQDPINRLYGTYSSETGKSGLILADSTIYAMGTSSAFTSLSSQVYLIKTDKSGNLLWTKYYGGTGVDDGIDMYVDVALDTSIYILSNSFINFSKGYDVKLTKVDKSGNLIWEKNYGTSDWDVPSKMIKTSSGLFAICGKTYGNSLGLADGMLLFLDENGDSLSFQNFGDTQDNFLLDLVEKTIDSIAVCGETYTASGKKRGWILEMNIETGAYKNSFFGSVYNRTFNAIKMYPNGNYMIGLTTDSTGITQTDMYLELLDKNSLAVTFEIPILQANDEVMIDVEIINNQFCFMGLTKTYGLGGWEVVVYRFDSVGAYKGSYTFGTSGDDYAADLIKNNNGTFAIVGTTGGAFGVTDLWVVNVDSLYQNDDVLDSQLDINSIHENIYKNDEYVVFPNPFNDQLSIVSNLLPTEIKLVDGLGRVLANSTNSKTLTVGSIPSGAYYLKVSFENYPSVTKCVIKTR